MSDPIVDEDKVQEMSAALAEGRRVRFSPDGQSSASLDAGNPIQQPAADFISTKLDEINDLLGRGFEVAVDPDGSVFAYNADRTGRYLANPDAQIDSMEQLFVHESIRRGGTVVIESDGSIAYQIDPAATAPSPEAVAARIAQFDAALAGGDVSLTLQNGKSVTITPDGVIDFTATSPSAPPAAATPAAPAPAAPPALPDIDAAEIRADVVESGQVAQQIRDLAFERLEEDAAEYSVARDAAARRAWASDNEAKAADIQVKRELLVLDKARDAARRHEQAALKGDEHAAELLREANIKAETASQRVEAAREAATAARGAAEAARDEVATLEASAVHAEFEHDVLLEQARHMDGHTTHLELAADAAEQAEMKDAEAAEARAAGDIAGADALAAEAANHRRLAQQQLDEAKAVEIDALRMEHMGIDLPDDVDSDPDNDVAAATPETTPADATDATAEAAATGGEAGQPVRVIDMEPEVIEVDVPEAPGIPGVPDIEVPAEIEMPVEVTVDMPDDSMDAAADLVATNDFADDLGAIDTAAGELDGLMDI